MVETIRADVGRGVVGITGEPTDETIASASRTVSGGRVDGHVLQVAGV